MTKKLLLWVGVLLFVEGIFSFIPNPLVGTTGFFELSTLSAIVSIVVGIYFIYASHENEEKHHHMFKLWGITFVIVAILGFLLGITLNISDAWLFLIIGIAFIALSEKTKIAKTVAAAK